ncbi:MAG: hypothetical protein GWO81_07340 [Verrucomicrobia bacterium]|nr:hypothetical protein [Verrucomicrobiota bacterium]
MRIRTSGAAICICFACALNLSAEETVKSPLESVERRAGSIQEKRASMPQWSSKEKLSLTDKRMSYKSWSKHFSSVGSKRAPVEVQGKEQPTITKSRKEYSVRTRKMSSMDGERAGLEKKARIGTKDEPLLLRDVETYAMMLQGAAFQEEMGRQLSLRDLNRFQFRRNRSESAIPVKQAGSGER